MPRLRRSLPALLGAALATAAPAYRMGGARLVGRAEVALRTGPSERGLEELGEIWRGLDEAARLTTTSLEEQKVEDLRRLLSSLFLDRAVAAGDPARTREGLGYCLAGRGGAAPAEGCIPRALRVLEPEDAARALERHYLDRSLPQGTRDRVAEALADLRWELSEGRPGRHLGALAWLLDQWLPGYQGARRREFLALGGEVALRRHEFEVALRRFEDADSLGHLKADHQRQLHVLRTMHRRDRQGTLVEAAPDSFFTVQVGARLPYADAEVLRESFVRARSDWAARFGFAPRENVLVRVLLQRDWNWLFSRHVEGLTEDSGILLRLRPGEELADLEALVRHEYVHFALERMVGFRRLPRWLHEGVATWFEASPLPVRLYRRLLDARQQGAWPDGAGLRRFQPRTTRQARALYDTAALLVARRARAGGDGAVQRLLEGVARGEDLEEVWRQQTGRSLDRSVEELREGLLEEVRDRIRREREGPDPAPEPGEEPVLILHGEGGVVLRGEEPADGIQLLPGPDLTPHRRPTRSRP